jgi:hypothetical protein
MATILVLYASQDKQFAEAFIHAAQAHEPANTFDARDEAGASALNAAELAQYALALAFISPAALDSPAIVRVLETGAALGPGKWLAVVIRFVEPPPFLRGFRLINAERLSPGRLADLIFAPAGDTGAGGALQPPVTTAGEWPDIEEERSAPPPAPRPAPPPPPQAPAPEQPAAQPPDVLGGLPPGSRDQAPEPPATGSEQPRGTGGFPRQRSPRVETLQFTAYHPGATPVEAPQTLLVYSHIAAQADTVQNDAGTFAELGSMPQVAKGVAQRKVPRNVEITVEPHVEGVTFSPARDRFVWEGEWRRSLFRYTGAKELAGTTRTGWIDIYAGRVSPICTITVSLAFLGNAPKDSLSVPHGINVTSNVFDTVFISYSHRDREPMRQARATYEALGVVAYHDDLLEAGDNYEQRLAEMIRASNVFHLLWSESAAQSPEVRKEWLLALQANSDARFIRPWYWQEPLAPPPDELRARKISFRYEHLRRRMLRPSTWF